MKPLAVIVLPLAVLALTMLPLTDSQLFREIIVPSPYQNGGKYPTSYNIIWGITVLGMFSILFLVLSIQVCFSTSWAAEFQTRHPFLVGLLPGLTRGLARSIVESFPVYLYSEVKQRMMDQETTLECAICLSEFTDDEHLRFIPHCHHVFHPECIDTWFASHTTCPVCRADLTRANGDSNPEFNQELARMQMDEPRTENETQNLHDTIEIEEEQLQPTPRMLPRSHTTGHSLPVEDCRRYTLWFREDVQDDEGITVLRRAKSCGCDVDGNSRSGSADDGTGGELLTPDGIICGRSDLRMIETPTFNVEADQGELSSSAADLPV